MGQDEEKPVEVEIPSSALDYLVEHIGMDDIRESIEQLEDGSRQLFEMLFTAYERLEMRVRELEGDPAIQVVAKPNVSVRNGTMEIVHVRRLPSSLRKPEGIWKQKEIVQKNS